MAHRNIMAPMAVRDYALCNALGMDRPSVEQRLFSASSGLLPLRDALDWALPFETFVGALPESLGPLPASWSKYDSRATRMALHLAEQVSKSVAALRRRWGAHRVALLFGTSTGSMDRTEFAYRHFVNEGELPAGFSIQHQGCFSHVAEFLARWLELEGPMYTVSTACSSSAKIAGSAQRLMASGIIDAAVLVGIDVLCELTLRGFHSLGILSATRCRPFSEGRDGINIGEGGGICVVERDADASAFILGVGESSDAYHMSAPHPEGLGARRAIVSALDYAGLSRHEIDHINAHGTGTALNDSAEAQALFSVFGLDVPTVSTKGYVGHLLGAAGITEMLFSLMCLDRQAIPASLGAEPIDSSLPILLERSGGARRLRNVVTTSLAFGGNNAAVIVGQERTA